MSTQGSSTTAAATGTTAAPSTAAGAAAPGGFRAVMERPASALVLRVTLLLVVFAVLDDLVIQGTRMPAARYADPSIVLSLLAYTLEDLGAALGVLLILALAGWRTRIILQGWPADAAGGQLRRFMVVVGAILAWRFATYDYNLYLDQAHYLDRLLLIALVALLYWRPVFVFPLAFVAAAIIWQFADPLGFSWAQQLMPLRILTLFAAMLLLGWVRVRVPVADFLLVLCCLVASHYFVPGLGKLELGWLGHESLGNLLPATYANGWLGFLDPGLLSRLARLVTELNPVVTVAALLFQLGALLVLWRRSVLLAFLGVATGFHLAVFALSGILFWQWVAVDIALVVLIRRLWPAGDIPICGRCPFALGLVLIGGAMLWFKPVKLAWYDVPVSYTYRLEAIADDGRRHALPPRFFAPYDYPLTLGAFAYLVDGPHLGVVWGASRNPDLADALARDPTPQQVAALEAEHGRNRFDPVASERFDAFVRQFVRTFNRRGSGDTWLSRFRAPPQLWTFPRADALAGDETLSRVEVYQITSLFDGLRYAEIDRRLVRRIEIR